jgi:hypothetical protein
MQLQRGAAVIARTLATAAGRGVSLRTLLVDPTLYEPQ